nr:putative glycoside hydrolase [Gemmatimonadota bacterium]
PPARIIPWIQAFTAGWVDRSYRYGPEQARAQMRAVYALGLEDWILWNGASKYAAVEGALEPELRSRAERFVAPASLVARVDRMDGWGVAEARRRAVREWIR